MSWLADSKILLWIKKNRQYFFILVVLCLVAKGCDYFPESSFELASESRLPKWITLPKGTTRADVSITMNYYSLNPWGGSAEFFVKDTKKESAEKIVGHMKCGLFNLRIPRQTPPLSDPVYQIVTVRGMTEIMEHKKMQPIFYVTDDPAVWDYFRMRGCS